ncbi:hypothetical protein BFS14_14895 [Serratia fonticola]|uniref:hypothetical protein n=1 Tax=Serratia fonticola TaxID=47917 RepID=UPI0008FD7913|nr:hypothetical protein [Serratia fonticola]MBC3252314.1 hypothetical protein [Serratia fonticola]OIX95643.1 hypothetical protein BFS14_14895 [Serratia fonticola]QCR62155.1 hypothetical protein FD644_18175 [Serratia fonticola]
MRRGIIRKAVVLPLLLLAGVHHPLVRAGNHASREARIAWHYPHARLIVDCSLPVGTVLASVTLPLPPGVPPGDSSLSVGNGTGVGWTTLATRLPGLSVRAALDQNAVTGEKDGGPRTGLRLELVRDGPVRSGWLSVPEQDLWWNVTDAVTHTRLWRGRILWKGRMKIETEQDDVDTTGRGGCA